MSKQLTPYQGYRVCTDGSLNPAEVRVTNYLIREYGDLALEILHKFGLQEIRDYRTETDDDTEYLIIKVRPDAYDLMEEMLVELARKSREMHKKDKAERDCLDSIREKEQEKMDAKFAEIANLMGEDEEY